MRRVGIVLLVLVIVVIVGAAIFAATFDVNKYRATIQSELENRLGRKVTLGDMHLGLLPPRFRVQDLAIADDPRFNPDAPFVKTKELDVSVKLLPLLHKEVQLSSLDLQRPRVSLRKNHAGVRKVAVLSSLLPHNQNRKISQRSPRTSRPLPNRPERSPRSPEDSNSPWTSSRSKTARFPYWISRPAALPRITTTLTSR